MAADDAGDLRAADGALLELVGAPVAEGFVPAREDDAVDDVLAADDADVRVPDFLQFLGDLVHLGLEQLDGLSEGAVLLDVFGGERHGGVFVEADGVLCFGVWSGAGTVEVFDVEDRDAVDVVELFRRGASDQVDAVLDGRELVEGPRGGHFARCLDQRPLLARHVVLVEVVELFLVLVDAAEDEEAVADAARRVSVAGQRPRARGRLLEVPEVGDCREPRLPKLNW